MYYKRTCSFSVFFLLPKEEEAAGNAVSTLLPREGELEAKLLIRGAQAGSHNLLCVCAYLAKVWVLVLLP